MTSVPLSFGVLDNRFLSRSVGLLNPPPPATLEPTASLREAVELLQEHRIGSIVITDPSGKLLGIFTERDVVLKLCLSNYDLDRTPISELMTPNPHAEQMTTTIAYALNMMSVGGYRHIPIVDDENVPVGIVSVKDIVDYIAGQLTKDLTSFSSGSKKG